MTIAPGQDVESAEAYLRAHVGRFRYQELDAQLRAGGHTEAAIAEAWRRLTPAGSPIAERRDGGLAGFVHRLGFVVLGVAYGLSIVGGLGGSLRIIGGDAGAGLVSGGYAIVLIVTWWLGMGRLGRLRRRGAGLRETLGALVLVAAVWLLVTVLVGGVLQRWQAGGFDAI